jgi:hypothetical protein
MVVQISNEFLKFCSGLHQDFLLYGPQPQDWINGALQFVPRDRQPALKDYLNELLKGDYSDAKLQEIFRSTYAEVRINDRGVRPFLAMIRDTIESK